jgi:putative MFS transporter
MAFQTSGFGVDLWRFIAGIGIGVELVTIDTYVSELVPRSHRGRAYAFNQFFQFLAVPIVAFLAWLLIPHAPLGLDGWRWVVLIGSGGAIVIWFIRLALPESPRWLARRGRLSDAERVVEGIERRVAAEARASLPLPGPTQADESGQAPSPKSGSRLLTSARSCCRCSTSSRPSAITALPPGSRPC